MLHFPLLSTLEALLSTAVVHDTEPTPEFYSRSMSIMSGWQSGALPFAEVERQLLDLNKEAATGNHLANQGRIEQILGVIQSYRGNLNISIHHYASTSSSFITYDHTNFLV